MKILYLTDSHTKGINPLYRRGNYYSDIKDKIKESISISKERECDLVLHGGDVFDAPMVSLNICDTFVDEVEKAGIDWLITRGNHDEIGHNPDLSGSSILDHIFRRSTKINHLESHLFDDIYIEGFDYRHGIERQIKEKGLISSTDADKKKIAVVHAFMTFEKFLPQVLHTTIGEVKTDFNLVLIAHCHFEQGIKKIGGTTFIGIGSLARMTVAKRDIDRIPNVLFIDTEKSILEIIPLKSAKKPEEVFDLKRLGEKRDYESSINQFIDSLENTKFQSLNLRGVIETLSRNQGYDKEVIEEVVDRIGRYEVIEK